MSITADRPAGVPHTSAGGIEARGVRRAFGAVRAVDGVDLAVRPGTVTALVGPNGSGKTTLLLVLAGLLRPDAGEVRVAGIDVVAGGARARAHVGWMPDVFGTWDSLTAREVLLTMGAAYRMPREDAASRARELLALVHLTDLADRPAHVLSRGQKQRLGLARALVHRPDVLLLDEPASGLDPRSRVDLRVLVRELAGAGAAVLISSHVLSELDEMVDEAVVLARGRTVATEQLRGAAIEVPWRLRALSRRALVDWLGSSSLAWQPDGEPAVTTVENPFARPRSGPDAGEADGPGAAIVRLASEQAAAELLRAAVTAGVPVAGLAPVGNALEQAYLALEEERR